MALASVALFCGASVLASPPPNVDEVKIQYIPGPGYPVNQVIIAGAGRWAGNPHDPIEATITESSGGTTVTVTIVSAAAGGLQVSAPCVKTAADTAVCPTSFDGKIVKQVRVTGSPGDDDILIDTPSLSVSASGANGDDTISVPRCTTSFISGGDGDDVLYGGTGADSITGDQGDDYIYAYTNPAAPDSLVCGPAYAESPSDTVVVDSADTVTNSSNCLQIVQGP